MLLGKNLFLILSNGPHKKDSMHGKECKKVLTLLLLYRTSDWLNQKNLPELQAAVQIFIRNLSIIFLSSQSLLSLKTTVILCGENWKFLLSLFTTVMIG